MSYPAPAPTDRNERIANLAGCTTLAVELVNAQVRLNEAVKAHRKAQALAAKPYSIPGASKPAGTRLQVRKAIARIRAIQVQIESTYGERLPKDSALREAALLQVAA